MARREHRKLLTPAEEEGRCADEQRACPLPGEVGEDSIEIGFGIDVVDGARSRRRIAVR
jgi:hypothetical protein